MIIINKIIILSVTALSLLFLPYAHGYENTEETIINKKNSSDPSLKNYIILPHIGLQIENKVYSANDPDFKMAPHRIIDLDILRIKNIIFSMYMDEYVIYKNNLKRIKPWSINYVMDYVNLRWENNYGIFGLFFDHMCTNYVNEQTRNDRQIRWYGAGIRWESYGMKPGQKQRSGTDLINNLNYRISISKAVSTKVLYYDYLANSTLRYDILKYNIFIPYFEGSLTSLIDGDVRFNWGFETGLRITLEKCDLTPFIGIDHKYDVDYYHSKPVNLYFAGLRMETLLGNVAANSKSRETAKSASFPPEFHFRGSYGKYINDNQLNFNSDIFMGLDFPASGLLSPFIYDTLKHNSQTLNSGMFPRYIDQKIETGISCRLDFIDSLLEPFYSYTRLDEGNNYKGYTERHSSAGLRLTSRRMKAGSANNGINFENENNFEGISTLDWSVSAERAFNKFYYKYSWEYNIMLRWNILRYESCIPYISGALNLLAGNYINKVYNAEAGIRIQSGLMWMLFYRFEHPTAVDPANGVFKNYNLIGARIEI